MFKNKHVVAALIITPILAVLGYLTVDSVVSEKPHAAKKGDSYELVEKPNCRYSSGVCGLKNNEFELTLTTDWLEGDAMRLNLKSVVALDSVKVALVNNVDQELPPVDMQPIGDEATSWVLDLPRPDRENSRLRVAASAGGVWYYGDAAMKFTLYETIFKEDFRQ